MLDTELDRRFATRPLSTTVPAQATVPSCKGASAIGLLILRPLGVLRLDGMLPRLKDSDANPAPALQGSRFTSVRMLVQAIEVFIASWNENAAPFQWTKKEVHQQKMKRSYADLCN